MWQKATALRDFNLADVRFGSILLQKSPNKRAVVGAEL